MHSKVRHWRGLKSYVGTEQIFHGLIYRHLQTEVLEPKPRRDRRRRFCCNRMAACRIGESYRHTHNPAQENAQNLNAQGKDLQRQLFPLAFGR